MASTSHGHIGVLSPIISEVQATIRNQSGTYYSWAIQQGSTQVVVRDINQSVTFAVDISDIMLQQMWVSTGNIRIADTFDINYPMVITGMSEQYIEQYIEFANNRVVDVHVESTPENYSCIAYVTIFIGKVGIRPSGGGSVANIRIGPYAKNLDVFVEVTKQQPAHQAKPIRRGWIKIPVGYELVNNRLMPTYENKRILKAWIGNSQNKAKQILSPIYSQWRTLNDDSDSKYTNFTPAIDCMFRSADSGFYVNATDQKVYTYNKDSQSEGFTNGIIFEPLSSNTHIKRSAGACFKGTIHFWVYKQVGSGMAGMETVHYVFNPNDSTVSIVDTIPYNAKFPGGSSVGGYVVYWALPIYKPSEYVKTTDTAFVTGKRYYEYDENQKAHILTSDFAMAPNKNYYEWHEEIDTIYLFGKTMTQVSPSTGFFVMTWSMDAGYNVIFYETTSSRIYLGTYSYDAVYYNKQVHWNYDGKHIVYDLNSNTTKIVETLSVDNASKAQFVLLDTLHLIVYGYAPGTQSYSLLKDYIYNKSNNAWEINNIISHFNDSIENCRLSNINGELHVISSTDKKHYVADHIFDD